MTVRLFYVMHESRLVIIDISILIFNNQGAYELIKRL